MHACIATRVPLMHVTRAVEQGGEVERVLHAARGEGHVRVPARALHRVWRVCSLLALRHPCVIKAGASHALNMLISVSWGVMV